jgi:hypothetical protein
VGKGANLYELGYRFHGSAAVITRFIRTAWLWDQVRVQGGAYGAFCLFDRLSGTLTFVSYRDPNLERTLGAFDETSRFLKKTDLGESELTKAIIGAIGDLDTHMLPDAKGYASMGRYLSEDTESTRQQMRSEILCTEPSHFRAFAEVLDQVSAQGIVKVLGSADAIGAGPAGTMKPLQILKVR